MSGLNPYCSGQWSRTCSLWTQVCTSWRVLILVVVDNGLVLGETIHLTGEVEMS